ncbi:hypothetical protein PIROE2DRAFT_10058 [Piromyces sp. E2]|nr:hypothetical protein PIROE2DRAFT_10058 [Piromyces sp. E2]|eukprot:OUM63400.1 hypothetical protein PIROE2DRAFT_10058 [Piromyces sp. E2]
MNINKQHIENSNINNNTLLLKACETGDENIDNLGRTPLYITCNKGNINIVKYLVEHGMMPLYHARDKGHKNMIKYLEEHGDIYKK